MTFSPRRLLAAFRRPADPFERAVLALERGDAAGAVAAFTAVLHQAPNDQARVRIHNKRGVAHVNLGRRDEALRDFTEALAIDPAYAPAITNIGNLLFEDGDVDEAIAHYEAAVRADENYPLAHLNLGIAYRRAGRRAAAVREMRLANRLEGRALFRRRPGGD